MWGRKNNDSDVTHEQSTHRFALSSKMRVNRKFYGQGHMKVKVILKVKGQNTNSRQPWPLRPRLKTVWNRYGFISFTTSRSRSYQCQGHITAWVITAIEFWWAIHYDLTLCAKETTFLKAFIPLFLVQGQGQLNVNVKYLHDVYHLTKVKVTRNVLHAQFWRFLGHNSISSFRPAFFPTRIQHIGNTKGQG